MTKEKVVKGSGNVFADLGFKQPEEMQARAHLVHQIYTIISERGLKQKEAAEVLGIKQPDVSAIMNGRFIDFSLDRLLQLLVRLNREVEIVIKPVRKGKTSAGIHVSAI